ncbi:MAG: thioredoxin [Anaerolineales bacterium]
MPRIFDTPIFSNDQSIDRVLAAGLPLTIIFYDGRIAEDLKFSMERLAREYAGKVLIAQIQKKGNPVTSQRFAAGQEPSIVTLKDGQPLTKAEGVSAADFEKHLLYLLGKGPLPAQNKSASQNQRNQYQSNQNGAKPHIVSDTTFDQEVLRSDHVVLVDFWAPWCGPCRMTEPILDKLAGELAGQVVVAKVNVDENPLLSQKYGVQSIPTMMIVKGGQIVDRWVGALPEAAIRGRLAVHTR